MVCAENQSGWGDVRNSDYLTCDGIFYKLLVYPLLERGY